MDVLSTILLALKDVAQASIIVLLGRWPCTLLLCSQWHLSYVQCYRTLR